MEKLKEIKLIEKVYTDAGKPNNEVQAFALKCLIEYKKQLSICDVVSSAWYCKISTTKGQWFEIVTGENETEVAVKIVEKFGKETVYNLIDKYELI